MLALKWKLMINKNERLSLSIFCAIMPGASKSFGDKNSWSLWHEQLHTIHTSPPNPPLKLNISLTCYIWPRLTKFRILYLHKTIRLRHKFKFPSSGSDVQQLSLCLRYLRYCLNCLWNEKTMVNLTKWSYCLTWCLTWCECHKCAAHLGNSSNNCHQIYSCAR